jgi:hypothetical protein|tara:strand:- start:14 stop:160 length:147 start_codon:yes stop_codon:yes gene_type:complete
MFVSYGPLFLGLLISFPPLMDLSLLSSLSFAFFYRNMRKRRKGETSGG